MFRSFAAAASAALLLAACSKTPEDLTARYTMGGQPGAMTIKAAANGDARVEMMGSAMVRHNGVDYLVGKDAQGSFAAKVDDFIGLAADAMREAGFKPGPLGPQPAYDLVKGGSETIADVKGDVWEIKPGKDAPAAPQKMDAVVSEDPTYANVGKALMMQTRLASVSQEQMRGGVGSLEKKVQELLGKGMVLRFGSDVKLDKIEKTKFEANTFELPKPVLDRAALKARLDARRAAEAKMAPQMNGPVPPAQGAAPAPAPAAPAPAPTAPAK
ncbi:hypothetical protein AB2M62_18995 [Sphingomonas sp. MMS12-HWE2-04]|uniref:hypothetical protein n=1 Tax=Sphingomonas sp. MMS12-HWE2-04 TaxID=3234199 RepID=UPI00384C9678